MPTLKYTELKQAKNEPILSVICETSLKIQLSKTERVIKLQQVTVKELKSPKKMYLLLSFYQFQLLCIKSS